MCRSTRSSWLERYSSDRRQQSRNNTSSPKFNIGWGLGGGLAGYIKQARTRRPDKEILLSRISSIELRPAHLLAKGYLRFTFSGSGEPYGEYDPATDENALVFKTDQQAQFEAFKRAADNRIAALDARSGLAPVSTDLDELKKLATLRDDGVITQEEFDAKKKQLLGL